MIEYKHLFKQFVANRCYAQKFLSMLFRSSLQVTGASLHDGEKKCGLDGWNDGS